MEDKFRCDFADCPLDFVGDEGCAMCPCKDEAFYCEYHREHPHIMKTVSDYEGRSYAKNDRIYGYYRG